ncbi:hypothetical protein RUM43_000641, partial [Polyplax serrata]
MTSLVTSPTYDLSGSRTRGLSGINSKVRRKQNDLHSRNPIFFLTSSRKLSRLAEEPAGDKTQ